MIKKLSKLLLSFLMVLTVLDLSGLSVKAEDNIDVNSLKFTMSTFYVHKGEPLQLEYLVNGEEGVDLDVTFSKPYSYENFDITPQGLFTSNESGWFNVQVSYGDYIAYSQVRVLTDSEVLLTVNAGEGYFVRNWDSNIPKSKVKYKNINKGESLYQLYWSDYKTDIDNDYIAFSEWYYDAAFTNPVKNSDIINEDTTVYAKYGKETYMVTAHYNDGYTYGLSTTNGIAKLKVPKGEAIGSDIDWEIYSNDESKGFEAWYFEEDFSGTPYFYLQNYIPTSDIDVYAKYSPLATVTFDYNGGYWLSGDEKKYTDSYTFVPARKNSLAYWYASAPLIDDPNYAFSHWELADGTRATDDIIPTGDMTLYAVYEEAYTVRYHVDINRGHFYKNGERVADIEEKVVKGERIQNRYALSYKEGYGLLGWYLDSEFENKIEDFYSFVPTSNIDLYARMSSMIYVTFDANGGYFYYEGNKSLDFDYLTESDRPMTISPSVENSDKRKRHVGFSYDREGNNPVDFDIFYPQENVTVYAMWEDGVIVTFHMMEGKYNGQSEIATTYAKGSNLNIGYSSYRPSREGYVFDKWYLTPERDGKGYDYYELNNLYQELNEDIHLYAGYKKQYKLTFDANGEKFTNNKTQKESLMNEGSMVNPNSTYIPKGIDFLNPSKVFVGWYDNPECLGEKETFIDYVLDSDKTYYAKWEDEYYTITFHGMGGTYNNQTDIIRKYQKNAYINETVPLFSKFGFGRGDWYYDEELTQKADIVAGSGLMLNIDRDYDLYVSYLPYYKVYVDSNGGEFYSSFNQGKTVVEYTSMEEGYTMYKLSTGLMKSEVDGKVFAGYSLSPNGEVDDYVGKIVTEDVTLYAIYTEDFVTVTLRTEYGGYYNNTTGKYDKEKVYKLPKGAELRHSQSIANVEGPTERYEVIYKTKKGDIAEIGNGLYYYVVDEDEVINAEFTFFDTVKVRFHGNGGLSSSGEEVDERTTIRGKPYNYDFYYDIYFYYPDNSKTFLRFTYDQEGKKLVRPYDLINEDTDIYAQWSDEVWTITYNYNGGYSDNGKSIETEKVFKGKNTSYHYASNDGSLGQFIGWFTEPEGGEPRGSQGGSYTPTKDETLYAHFEKEIVTLTLDAGNGYFNNNINNKVATNRFAKGALGYIGYPPTHPEGFEFVGYYDNPQFTGDKYGYQITLYNDLTLYAKFNEVIIPVESVVINQNDLTLKETQSSKLTATVYPDNANNKKLIWSSSDDSVATVSSTGLVTAVAPGTATITVTSEYDNSIKDSITVTVLETPTYTVKFDGAGGTTFDDQVLLEGEKATNPGTPTREGYVFSGWYLGEEKYNFDNEVTSNITIIAKWTEEDEVVYVNEIKFDGDINEATIKVGEKYFIVAYPHPANATDRTITYTSEDTGVATVDENGKVTGVSEGTTKIVLTSGDGNVTAKFTIHVVNIPDSLETDVLVVKPEEMELKQGSTGSLTAYPPSDATNQEVVWESEDSSIATVDKNGKVSAHKAGTVTIKAKLKGADLNALNEAVTYAENEYAAAEEALKEAEEVEEAARQLAENKDTIYRSAKSNEESAIANNEDAKQAYEAAVAKKPAAQKRVEDANEAVAEAEKAYERGEERLAQAAQSVEDAEEKVAQAQAAIDEGSLGFFRHYGATEAIKIIEDRVTNQVGNNGWGHTNVGANGDATSLENMKTAINFIAVGNELIANDDIQVQHNYAILKVTDRAMAVAQVQTNASSTNINHSQMNKYGENLAWGNRSKEYGGYDGWYFKEKRVYDWIVANGLNRTPSSWTEEQRRQCIKDCGLSSVSDIQVGHYINLVARGYLTTGYAINNVPRSNPYGETQGQVFGQENWSPDVLTPSSMYCPGRDCTFDPQYTVEEYMNRFNAYYDVIMGAFETAQAELDAALTYKERLSETNGLTDEEWQILTEAEKEAKEATQALSEIESEIFIAESDYKQTQHSLELFKKIVASALAEKEEAEAAYLVAQQDVENKVLDKAQKSRAFETAKHNLKRVQATAKVTVVATIEKVEVDKTKLELKVGESSKVTATITPSDATNKNVTWISSNPDYVTVDEEGNITAIKRTKDNEPIKVIVRTEEGLKEAEVEVTVIQPVTGVAIDITEVTLEMNESNKLTATVLPEDANNQEVTWSSDNTKIVTVDQNGNIKAVGAGTATITVTTKDGNKTATATITVNKINIGNALISDLSEKNYTGKAITQTFSVTLNGKPLTEGTDYTVSYTDNTDVGTATVNITGKGNYEGMKTATFKINPIKVDIPTAKTGLVYNGKSQTGVTTGDKYTLTGNTGTNAGSYTAVATLKDKKNYVWNNASGDADDKEITWNIAKASIDKATVSAIANQTFTGKEIKPVPTVKLGTTTLKNGTDYTLSYTNNKAVGTATVTIEGKGNYTGTVSKTFKIENIKITLNKTSATIGTKNVGKYKNKTSVQLTATVTGANANNVKWTVSDTKVAKLNKTTGKTVTVSAVGDPYYKGSSVTVTATINGKRVTCKVTVEDPINAFVRRLYKYCLNRNPDKGGFDYWTSRLRSKKITAAEAVKGFFDSKEMKDMKLSNAETIERCYLVMMDRKSDKGGKDYWIKNFKKYGKVYVLRGFVDSKEFTQICKDFNINKGTIK